VSNLKRFLSILIILFIVCDSVYALGSDFYLADGTGVTSWEFDIAGYSDGFYWGESQRHLNYVGNPHEMLSGEWASGIYYNGIHNNKTQWLTDWFMVPDWPTYTSFIQDSNFQVWNNHRTARSRVYDSNVRVTIDYNLIDLGESNCVSLPFRNYSGNIRDVSAF